MDRIDDIVYLILDRQFREKCEKLLALAKELDEEIYCYLQKWNDLFNFLGDNLNVDEDRFRFYTEIFVRRRKAFKGKIPISFETSYVTRLILVWAGRFGKIPLCLKTFLEDKEVERRVKSCFIPYR